MTFKQCSVYCVFNYHNNVFNGEFNSRIHLVIHMLILYLSPVRKYRNISFNNYVRLCGIVCICVVVCLFVVILFLFVCVFIFYVVTCLFFQFILDSDISFVACVISSLYFAPKWEKVVLKEACQDFLSRNSTAKRYQTKTLVKYYRISLSGW